MHGGCGECQEMCIRDRNILLRDGDDVYVEAVQQGLLYEGQTVRLF